MSSLAELLKAVIKTNRGNKKREFSSFCSSAVLGQHSKHTSLFRERMLLPGTPPVLADVSREKVGFF